MKLFLLCCRRMLMTCLFLIALAVTFEELTGISAGEFGTAVLQKAGF